MTGCCVDAAESGQVPQRSRRKNAVKDVGRRYCGPHSLEAPHAGHAAKTYLFSAGFAESTEKPILPLSISVDLGGREDRQGKTARVGGGREMLFTRKEEGVVNLQFPTPPRSSYPSLVASFTRTSRGVFRETRSRQVLPWRRP